MSNLNASLIDGMVTSALINLSGNYNLTAVVTLLLWDILLTLPREILYIWSYRRTATSTTLFYIIARYLPFTVVAILTGAWLLIVSYNYFTLPAFIGLFALWAVSWFVILGCADILIIKRTIALYDGSKLLSRTLISLFVLETIIGIGIPVYRTTTSEDIGHQIAALLEFPSVAGYNLVFPFMFPELAFQALLVMLILGRVVYDWRSGITNNDIVSILVRDNIWSYFLNLSGLLIIIIAPSTWLSAPLGYPNMLWSSATLSVTSSRLLLNIRAACVKRSTEHSLQSISFVTIQNDTFGHRPTVATLSQRIRSFFASGDEELSISVQYSDLDLDYPDY